MTAASASPVRRRETCRLCAGGKLELALPMKPSPIADAYVPAGRRGAEQPLYPLDLYLCMDCGHVQNLDVLDPAVLFRNYLFTTSSSGGLQRHYEEYARYMLEHFCAGEDPLIVEIGSNDGTLLKCFAKVGKRVVGIDPAREIAARATAEGVPTKAEFFTPEVAASVRTEQGPAALIAANNVFAHSDDLAGMADGIRELLADDGVFVFEVSYLRDIVDHFLFDTVYHEHVSYHSIAPLADFFKRHGLQLFDVHRVGSKGGSIRGFAQRAGGPRPVAPVVAQMRRAEAEGGLADLPLYRRYERDILQRKKALEDFCREELAVGRRLAGYGASTTTTTLQWHFELADKLAEIYDDNPRKQGLFSPGNHLPVLASEEIYARRPNAVIVLAWQYADPIIKRHARYVEEGGRFVVPLPELRVIGG